MECIEYCSPRWDWGDAHSGTRDLLPVFVTKLYEVIVEDDLQCFDECIGVVVVEGFVFFLEDKLQDVV